MQLKSKIAAIRSWSAEDDGKLYTHAAEPARHQAEGG
jgi:hypothetical protein